MTRALAIAPVLVLLVLYGWAASWPVAGVAAIALVASLALRKRPALGNGAQRVIAGVAIAIGIVVGLARTPEPGFGAGTLPGLASAIALPVLLLMVARAWIANPERGGTLTFALGIVAAGACGATRLGAGYAAFVAVYFATSVAALRAEDPARAPWEELPRRTKILGASIAIVAAALAFAGARALPPLYDYTQSRFDVAYEFVGFKGELRLGGLDDLKQSDEIVLRVSGARTDYLRGAVYDRFDAPTSSWGLSRVEVRVLAMPIARARGASGTEVRRVGGWGERYFFPLRAGAIGSPAAESLVDTMGVVRPAANKRYERYWFDADASDQLASTPPSAFDTRVPERLRAGLDAVVREWTQPNDSPATILAKIEQHLGDGYAYSLSFTRASKDPLLEFLTTNKQGNCEYFASAMALLARAANVPARVATGYRVAERNPISGEYLVRQKNAHAWVEAWVDGAWRSFDPTPASLVEENLAHDTSTARALADLVASVWAAALEWWNGLGPFELAGIALALAALFFVVRFARRGRRARAAAGTAAIDRSLPCLERLIEALARRGVAHAPSETLDRLARRAADGGMAEAAALLAKYAALRYGGVGDESALVREMDRCARSLALS